MIKRKSKKKLNSGRAKVWIRTCGGDLLRKKSFLCPHLSQLEGSQVADQQRQEAGVYESAISDPKTGLLETQMKEE